MKTFVMPEFTLIEIAAEDVIVTSYTCDVVTPPVPVPVGTYWE